MAEIIQMDSDKISVKDVLAKAYHLDKVLVLGVGSDGDFYGVSGFDAMEMIYIMEKCKHFLMKE
jgi:hypothetical protein